MGSVILEGVKLLPPHVMDCGGAGGKMSFSARREYDDEDEDEEDEEAEK